MAGPGFLPKTAVRNLADYDHWEDPGRAVRIYVHSRMADRLREEVLRAAASDSGNAREVGGILLGGSQTQGGQQTIFIDRFAAVPCSHRNGSAYELSEEDSIQLEAALLRAAQEDRASPEAPSILGYYRSHLREALCLSQADLQIAESYFQDPAFVMLIEVAAGARACTAGFFFWEDGRMQSKSSGLEIALGAVVAPEPELFVLPEMPAFPEPEALRTHAWQGLLLRAATILLAATALVVVAIIYLNVRRPLRDDAAASPAGPSVLGLQVERNPPDLLLFWNRYAREIAAAQHATLSISDGRIVRSVELDKSQLARGSYLYTPAGDDIQFRLEVFGPDEGSVAQSVHSKR